MKSFLVIALAIIATAGQISAQDNPLLTTLDRVTEVYNEFEEFKNASRFAIGDHIRFLSGAVLNVVIEEMNSWSVMMKQKCPALRNTAAQGEVVSRCAEDAVFILAFHQDAIFDILEDMNDASNAVSIRVFEELIEFNIITGYNDFDSHFDSILVAARNNLNDYVNQVGVEMASLIAATTTLQEDVRSCINAAFMKIIKSC
ncbi:hypothetical protein DMENIID0001_075150 [Sergentomyia squamirostris]